MHEYALVNYLQSNNVKHGDDFRVKLKKTDKSGQLVFNGKFLDYRLSGKHDGKLELGDVGISKKPKSFFYDDIEKICVYKKQFEPELSL